MLFVIVPVCYVPWEAKQRGRLQRLSQIFINDDIFQKNYPYKTKSIYLVMRFSPETTKENNMKNNRLCFKQDRN